MAVSDIMRHSNNRLEQNVVQLELCGRMKCSNNYFGQLGSVEIVWGVR